MNEKTKSKPTIQLVTIQTTDGKINSLEVFVVRHHDPRQAKAWLLEQAVTARRATQDEVIDIARKNTAIIGPFEKTAMDDVDENQLQLDVPRPAGE